MAQRKDTTNIEGMLFQFMGVEDPMFSIWSGCASRSWKWKFPAKSRSQA